MTTHTPAPAHEAVLTDDDLRNSGPFQWLARRCTLEVAARMLREFEGIVLSKLRAPVADERAAFERFQRRTGLDELYLERHATHGQYMWTATKEAWETWQARAALASAPVAGEATQKAKHDTCHAETEHERVTALAYWLDQQTFEPGMLSIAAATLRAMLSRDAAPQASEAQCSCPSGDGSLRHPCAVHPQASEAVRDADRQQASAPLLKAARRAVLALAAAAERDPAFQGDYDALSAALSAQPGEQN